MQLPINHCSYITCRMSIVISTVACVRYEKIWELITSQYEIIDLHITYWLQLFVPWSYIVRIKLKTYGNYCNTYLEILEQKEMKTETLAWLFILPVWKTGGGIGMTAVLAGRSPAARLSHVWPYIPVANKDVQNKTKSI